MHISYIKLRVIPELGSLDVVSDSEEANEDPGPINDREMKRRRKGERRRDRERKRFTDLLLRSRYLLE